MKIKYIMFAAACSILIGCAASKSKQSMDKHYTHDSYGTLSVNSAEYKNAQKVCEEKAFETPRYYNSPERNGLIYKSEPTEVRVSSLKQLSHIIFREYRASRPSNSVVETTTLMPAKKLLVEITSDMADCMIEDGWKMAPPK